jgi:D-sedoheptulose 7-phosphate isomerase
MNFQEYLELPIRELSPSNPQIRIDRLLQELREVVISGGTILTIGNGGSAATADHFAADLNLLRVRKGVPCRAVPLASLQSEYSALANDLGFEFVFSNLILSHATPTDLVVAFSASGSSPNLIKAIETCLSNRITVYPIVGFDGGLSLQISENTIHFPQADRNYGVAENIQLAFCHYISDRLEEFAVETNKADER